MGAGGLSHPPPRAPLTLTTAAILLPMVEPLLMMILLAVIQRVPVFKLISNRQRVSY